MLTGFGDFFEGRRFTFVDSMPASRVCAACGVVPSNAWQLPCNHVLCCFCEEQASKGATCPVDDTKYVHDGLVATNFPEHELGKRPAFCVVGGPRCDFKGGVFQMESHVTVCVAGESECTKCLRMVARGEAVDHRRQCKGDWSPESKETRERKTALPYSEKLPITPGPYRAAPKAGVSVGMCVIKGVHEKAALVNADEQQSATSDQCTLAGYTFRIRCQFVLGESEEVRVHFVFFLESGEWDESVAWPFSKKVTLVLSHPVDVTKDTTLPLMSPERNDSSRKPVPGASNNGYKTDELPWSTVLRFGHLGRNNLYVVVEME